MSNTTYTFKFDGKIVGQNLTEEALERALVNKSEFMISGADGIEYTPYMSKYNLETKKWELWEDGSTIGIGKPGTETINVVVEDACVASTFQFSGITSDEEDAEDAMYDLLLQYIRNRYAYEISIEEEEHYWDLVLAAHEISIDDETKTA